LVAFPPSRAALAARSAAIAASSRFFALENPEIGVLPVVVNASSDDTSIAFPWIDSYHAASAIL
jgi:hypothetical protein